MKSKYEIVLDNWDKIEAARKEGVTEKALYTQLKLNHDTWNEYKKDHPEFADMLKRAGQGAIESVENAVFLAATGQQKIKKTKVYKTKQQGKPETTHIEEVTEDTPINITAAIFFLQNRNSSKWQARPAENQISVAKLKMEKAIVEQQTGLTLDDIKVDFSEFKSNQKSEQKAKK